ncbi:MAG TPA: RNA polymerase sigma factor [Spirochaetota bacterium]|nr:RNA polymerase sigma factor [Spirochaetota bacterium]HPI88921.1 RNA polymerase sigma factor [Spirochaetota bacterium]HPR46602.1 RNA polymerase sigma factor [Spirochaetota bacterium]
MRADDRRLELFTGAYMEYYPMVLGRAMKKIGDRQAAEDICQEVFSIFYEKFDEVKDHRNWLLGTLKNVALRNFQEKGKDTADIEAHFDDEGLGYVNGFRDTRILLREAMDHAGCSAEDRALLDLVAVHGYSYSNAARVMGVTRRRAEYAYRRLVERIAGYLKTKGIDRLEELL